ncbi:MAG: hypothetical protein ACFFC7_01545 [Candidatus Hermodarchaeota archaeon]
MSCRLFIFIFLIVFISSFTMIPGSAVAPVLSKWDHSKLIPMGALFFYLNSSDPTEKYNLVDFVPDQSFVGRYNVQIECLLWLEDHDPVCDVIFRNIWNASTSPETKSTSDSFHSTYTYYYSRPNTGDPDFSACLELSSQVSITTPVEGWIYMSVINSGTTERPPNFTMPEHITNCIDHSESSSTGTQSSSSTGTQSVFFPVITVLITLFFLLLWKKRLNYKK